MAYAQKNPLAKAALSGAYSQGIPQQIQGQGRQPVTVHS